MNVIKLRITVSIIKFEILIVVFQFKTTSHLIATIRESGFTIQKLIKRIRVILIKCPRIIITFICQFVEPL